MTGPICPDFPLKQGHLFLIGPGGAGKTTCGRILAHRLSVPFIDLDMEFMTRIGNIDLHLSRFGYEDYFRKNSQLFEKLLSDTTDQTVFALSSGFLTYPNELVLARNKELIRLNGKSVCLMPSSNFTECVSVILYRQLNRGLDLNPQNQKATIEKRFWIYKDLGDFQVFSGETPDKIADAIRRLVEEMSCPTAGNA